MEEGLAAPLLGPVIEESQKGARSFTKDEILTEIKKQLYLAGPLMTINLLICGLSMISVMFVGHLGELALSGASMATSFASVTGTSLMIGMGSALDTFCGQSYGAKQYHMLGIHKQRAMIVLLSVSVPLAFIWFNAGHLLVFLGQDPEISAEAGLYARFMIPSLFANALLQCHVRFLQSQNNVVPMMLSTGITTLLHVLVCWIMVFKSGLGSRGAALANAVSLWINVLLLAIYIRVSPSCKRTWTGFSKEAFSNIPAFLKLAVPSAVMVCLEIWSFEMMVLLSGLLPNPQLETSVLSISLNTCSMIYMIPLGLSSATSVRVSNELGAGKAQAARLALRVSMFTVLTEGVLGSIILILGRKLWGYCYSNEEEVVSYIAQMMLLIAGSHIVDGIQSVLSGAVRGSGRQKIGAIVNLGAYYLFLETANYPTVATPPITAEPRVRAPLQGQPSPFFWDFQGKFPMCARSRNRSLDPQPTRVQTHTSKPDELAIIGRSLLSNWDSFGDLICFCTSYWGKGIMVRDYCCIICSSFVSLCFDVMH